MITVVVVVGFFFFSTYIFMMTSKNKCVRCEKDRSAVRCEGCLNLFCFNHLNEHRQELSQHLEEIELNRDIFKQNLIEQTTDVNRNAFLQEINQWEQQSIEIIQQTAKQCRQLLQQHINQHLSHIEKRLTNLTEKIKEARFENEFNEIDLRQWTDKLNQLTQQFNQPSIISIHRTSQPFIDKISVKISTPIHIDENTRWNQNGVTIAGCGQQGFQLNQLADPHGICVDEQNQCIYIADCSNHRIVRWRFGQDQGEIVAGGQGQGQQLNQLNGPKDVFLDKQTDSILITDRGNQRVVRWPCSNGTQGQIIISNICCWGITMNQHGHIVISDSDNNRVIKWMKTNQNRTIVAGGNGRGNQLNQLCCPTYICIDDEDSLFVSDSENHRVMKWTKDANEGIIVAGGHSDGPNSNQLDDAEGIFVDHQSNVYVADSRNHRVMRWNQNFGQGTLIIGGHGTGTESDQFRNLRGLTIDQQANIYVVDKNNHRVQRFDSFM